MTNGVVLWSGISLIDNRTPVVLIGTGFTRDSANRKTGPMIQTWILRADVSPVETVAERADAGICGGCPHRKQVDGSRTCYVNVGQAPRAIWAAWRNGDLDVATDLSALGDGLVIRLGAYGDPAAVPTEVWDALLSRSAGHTGYTHQWKSARLRGVTRHVQASCDSEEDARQAVALGLGYFRVKTVDAPMLPGETYCPADAHPGSVTCRDCLACSGNGARIVIDVHGSGAKHFAKRSALPVLA